MSKKPLTAEERRAAKKNKKHGGNDKHHALNAKAKSWAREWLDAIIFAGIAALIIRTFFFEAFRIPTPSMEKSLLVGDFLLVSKLDYGARTPMTIGIPFTSIYIHGLTLPWVRLPGFEKVHRYDVVVFNYPIDHAPISQKTDYIKRCIGLPGDTLSIKNKIVYIDHKKAKIFPTMEETYIVKVREHLRLSPARVHEAGGKIFQILQNGSYVVNMTKKVANNLSQWPEIASVTPDIYPSSYDGFANSQFTFSKGIDGNRDQFPPVVVPFKGEKVTLTAKDWHLYENIITRYEHNKVQRDGNSFIINGKKTNEYTIKQNYYFMMGDNRDNSEDSRYWGFVPQANIVGKAWIVYFSWDKNRMWPRFDRILHIIH